MADYGPLRANYQSMIDVLNLKRIENYQTPLEYPANFAGMVAALTDLNWGQGSTGVQPPSWDAANEEYLQPPSEGALWFDKRQGRLFIYVNGDWYQTNGGDGYATVQSTIEPTNGLRGQFWLEFLSKELYVHDGIGFVPVQSSAVLNRDSIKAVLNASADYASFKTNMLNLIG
tara:strand:+ start:18324 stop:18842 length:519 start_codon:yes stop_codon:yes gene_type:complete